MSNRTIAFLNLAGYIVMLTLNGLANALPLNGKTTGELSDQYANLFVPAGITFSIWGIIYILLLLYVIRGFQTMDKGGVVFNSGYLFLSSCILNASWIVAWHYEFVLLSMGIMLGLLVVLVKMYQGIAREKRTLAQADRLMVKVPVSVYLGWITVATIANLTAVLVDFGWSGFGISEVTWTIIVVITGLVVSLRVLQTQKDIAYGLVILWAYSGILIKRMGDTVTNDQPVQWVVIGSLALVGLSVVYFGIMGRNKVVTSNQ